MDSFTATMIKRAVLLLGPITVMTCIERLGRRKTFLGMDSLSASSLLMMGVLGAIQPASDGLKRGIVAVSILFTYTYIASFGSIMQIVPSEISHISLRDKTSMVYWMVSDVANFAATFLASISPFDALCRPGRQGRIHLRRHECLPPGLGVLLLP